MDGIYSKFDMVDNVKKLLGGISIRGEQNVIILSSAFKILDALKEGLKKEDEASNGKIELLKEQLKRATEPKTEEPGGDVIGGQHYEIDFGGEK